MSDTHQHTFKQWELEKIDRVQQLYNGIPGDKAFLVRQCSSCPARVYTDYGPTAQMEELLWEMVGKLAV